MDVLDKIRNEVIQFIESKSILNSELYNALLANDKGKIIEILVENGIEDIKIFGKLRYISEQDPDLPLTTEEVEKLKRKLFKMLK